MPSLADSLLSSAARPLGLRLRPDLIAKRQRYQGQPYWVVKDPVGLNYFRFQEEEFALLQMLDGDTSLDDLKQQFEEQFAPEQITLEELGQFVGMLHRSGLVIADMPGQGRQLLKRGTERWWQEFWSSASNVLAVRFKGVDPERLLTWLYPKLRWFYSRTCVILCLMLILSAVSLVLVQFDTFYAKLPGFHQFFQSGNWLWLGLVLCVTKVMHEFGHGLTCKHFKGECHELGFMLLVLTPCLYCNVSDSWMLPSKWRRAAIGAGGMYVELVVASIATFVWWFSEPGLLNQLALNTMFVCSVSTLIFNGNPLLRYDGYYILADITEIPNLRQKASTILTRKLGAWCLGLEEPEDPFLPQRNQVFFAVYSVASSVYTWFVTFSILFFLYKVFEPYHVQIIGEIIGVAALVGLVVRPMWSLWKYFRVPGRMEQVEPTRFRITIAVVAALVAFVAFVPLPYRVFCAAHVKARDAKTVYVEVPGTLKAVYVRPGEHVKKGDHLADLENYDLRVGLAELQGKRDQMQTQLESLMRSRYHDPQAERELPSVEQSLDALDEELREKQSDIDHLQLIAPADGWIIPTPDIPPPPAEEADEQTKLASWSGSPMDRKNRGATLKQGTPFCQIGNPKQMEAALVIDQSDIDLVAPGGKVVVKLDELPGDVFYSKVSKISQTPMSFVPRELSHKSGGDVQTKTDANNVERSATPSYEALAPIDDGNQVLVVGLRGRAKITASRWLSLGSRAWRAFSQTFHFKL
ncbi:MAG TPA: biotin/lipoyl-binding protein [Pirellulales bacterium]|jgi:putative peptide zinc metalloprotease protein|nr:biotin/lipoyl-binding protein [Pirellulales bacterium]